MIDLLVFIIGFFLISFLILIILVGVKFFCGIFNSKPSETTDIYFEEKEDNTETSQGDGLMGIDTDGDFSDILFPEELDEEQD